MDLERNPDELRALANKIEGLQGKFGSASKGLTGMDGIDAESTFGGLEAAGGGNDAISGFNTGMRKELSAGGKHASAAAAALRKIADDMDANEDDHARTFGGGQA